MAIKEKAKKEVPQLPEAKVAVMVLRGTALKIVPRGPGKMQVIQG